MSEPLEEIWKHASNCIGSIDGKRVTVKCPDNTESRHLFKLFPIVLVEIIGPDYKFLCVNISGYDQISDGIFEEPTVGKGFEVGTLNIPQEEQLPGQNEPTPHLLILVTKILL
jgi:hypothetical protein